MPLNPNEITLRAVNWISTETACSQLSAVLEPKDVEIKRQSCNILKQREHPPLPRQILDYQSCNIIAHKLSEGETFLKTARARRGQQLAWQRPGRDHHPWEK